MRVPHDGRVLVADGRKLLFLRNEGDAVQMKLEVEKAEMRINPANRDQATDAPGRTFSGVGDGRSAYQETDFHLLGKRRFAEAAAALLERGALAGDYESLIVIAPPATLGELRRHYHPEVERRITGELAKDLTGHPLPDIERALLDG